MELINEIWQGSGLYQITGGQAIMLVVCLGLLYLGIAKKFEPLLLVTIGFGGLLSNIPGAEIATGEGLLYFLYNTGITNGVFPLLIFMGVGALTDFGPLLANPRTLSIHPTGPFQPEEELGLFVASMWGMKHDAQWQIPSYSAWCENHDAEGAYRYLANLLRLVGWSQQVSSIRPWILKTPQHMLDLPALLKVFPDARLIFTHRDPQAVVGSAASLAWNQTILYSEHVDPADIGREWLRKTELMIARMRSARDNIPRERMIDVQYDEMDRDWRATMERIYAFLGLEMEPALAGMESYLEASKALKRHPHRYSLEAFGLSAGEVAERLGDYTRTYAIPSEAEAGGARAQHSASAR